MDARALESDGHGAEACTGHFCSSDSPETNGVYEEDALLPRIGDQYQVKIPPLKKGSKHQLRSISTNQIASNVASPGIGLAIPIMWVCCAADKVSVKYEKEDLQRNGVLCEAMVSVNMQKGSSTSDFEGKAQNRHMLHNSNNCIFPHSTGCSIESPYLLTYVKGVLKFVNCDGRDEDPNCSSLLEISKPISGYYPLPGSPSSLWSEADRQSFLLALYIFGKNLDLVKTFMEPKRMGDLLSYYYGEFFRSNAHRRWSECRKTRSKRRIHGHRIFTGWRQQEFLSRVLPTVNKEVQPTILEAVQAFNEGRGTLEEFVLIVKDAVGMQVLVEAIGIGKGKYDLTEVVMDPAKRNHSIPLRPEIPVGKACSSLTSLNIIKFLTGNFRLSKARSNDLFWEAVWPRLLANGWHSEQPKSLRSFCSKNALVFLVPGIKKFSRKRLVKGNHYFDSISDVLSKVASDPRLLELDGEGDNGNSNLSEGVGRDVNPKLVQDVSSTILRRSYLRPRIPYGNSEMMKFTVVDTSMAQGEGPFKVRELRSLPMDATSSFVPISLDSRSESSSSTDDSTNTSDVPDVMQAKQPEQSTTVFCLPDVAINGDCADNSSCFDVRSNKQNQALKYDQTSHSFSTSKRRRLTACSRGTGSEANSFQAAAGTSVPVANISLDEITVGPHASYSLDNSFVFVESLPNCELQAQKCFDLNNPPPGTGVAEPSGVGLKAEDPLQSSAACQVVDIEVMQASGDLPAYKLPAPENRRQSMRNRPPTARALEALACGFLGTKKKWKPSSSTTRPSRRARKTSMELEQADTSVTVSSSFKLSVDEIVVKHQNESLRKGTPELLGVP